MIKRIMQAAFCSILAIGVGVAKAEYPDKPINLLVPFTAGTTSDVLARMLAQHLQKTWGESVVVQNKPGAGGTIAMTQTMRAPADGYTLVLTSSGTAAINPHLYKSKPYDTDRHFVNVSILAALPFVLTVAKASPVKTLAEYVAKAKAQPGITSIGSTGVGSHQFLAGQQFMTAAGIKLNAIPYKGTPPQLLDLFGGALDSMMDNVATEIPLIREDKVTPLAVSSAARISQLPDVPTFGEAGVPGFVSTPWYGLAAPKGTPPAVVAKLEKETIAYLNQPDTRKKLEELGVTVVASTTADATKRVASENKEFSGVIAKLGLELQ